MEKATRPDCPTCGKAQGALMSVWDYGHAFQPCGPCQNASFHAWNEQRKAAWLAAGYTGRLDIWQEVR